MRIKVSIAVLALVLSGCGWEVPGSIDKDEGAAARPGAVPEAFGCGPGSLCAGAAKRAISPTQAQVDGIVEPRLPGTEVNQKFHLGGFGFGPFEYTKFLERYSNGALDERLCLGGAFCLSEPAARRPWHCKGTFAGCEAGSQEAELSWLHAFYLSQPDAAGAEVIFINLDAVGAGNLVIDAIKAAVSEATGVAPESVIVGMTHSHAGADLQGLWGGVPQEWVYGTLVAGAVEAAVEAKESSLAAQLTYGKGLDASLNNYRRPRVYPESEADTAFSVLQAKDRSGKTIGTIVQYAAHPTAIGSDAGGEEFGRAVHPDYPLGLYDTVEKEAGGIALYFNGPIADASGSGPTEGADEYERVRYRGDCMARTALSFLDPKVQPCAFSELVREEVRVTTLEPTLSVRHATATLPVTNPLFLAIGLTGSFNRYHDFNPLPIDQIPLLGDQRDNLPQLAPAATTTVSRVTIGGPEGLEIVTIPGEATNTFGQYIRGLTGNPNMMLFGLTQNSFGYIIPEEEFNYIDLSSDAGFVLPFTGYEEFVSIGPLTAPLLRLQAYNPLFDIPAADPRNLPPSVTACIEEPMGRACLASRLIAQVDYVQRAYANMCRENFPAAEAFCATLDPQTPIYEPCIAAGLPQALCDAVGSGGGGQVPE